MPLIAPTPGNLPAGLYVVTTPIGNLQDITLRAIQVLAQVDLIAAEDTRHTRRLLDAHQLGGRLISYHEHNESQRTPQLIDQLVGGASIALVTDAGTPMVSDPGYRLVCAAVDHHIAVVPIPGVSAAVTALSVSGLPTDVFTFVGFPDRRKSKRLHHLQELAGLSHTLIFYQAPHRLVPFLEELIEVLGDRTAVLAREMTKLHEEFIRGRLSYILAQLNARPVVRGECTVLVHGVSESADATAAEWQAALQAELDGGDRSLSQVVKELSLRFKIGKKQIYDQALRLQKTGVE